MKKVAMIAPNSLPIPPIRGGGIQSIVSEIIPLMREFKPYVFSNCEYGIDKLPLKETSGNIEHRRICQSPWEEFVIKLSHFTTRNYFPYVFEIVGQIKEVNPDIIHLMNRPWFLPILRKYLGNDTKIILHHFNNYLMEMKTDKAREYLELADGFIGCSNFTVNAEVYERFPEYRNKCFVVSNGINTDIFDAGKLDPDLLGSLRNKYGINNDDKVILYVGRLKQDKGAYELLKAVKILILNFGLRQIKLMIVGSSFFGGQTKVTPFMKMLQESSKEIRDNIIFTGFINRPDIPNIYGIADVVAVPSIVMDASPNVCYEASSMGLPIVGSKSGGIPEIIKDGETGLLVSDPRNIEDLAQKILFFIKNPEKGREFGKRGRELMEKQFTWPVIADKIERVYARVLKEK